MWNLTPDYIQQVKEELKGRRDAIQARYADELKRLEADLVEIETLERVAYDFAAKHLPEQSAEPAAEPEVGVEAQPQSKSQAKEVAGLQASSVDPAAADAASDGKGMSRWRLRLDARSDAESA